MNPRHQVIRVNHATIHAKIKCPIKTPFIFHPFTIHINLRLKLDTPTNIWNTNHLAAEVAAAVQDAEWYATQSPKNNRRKTS